MKRLSTVLAAALAVTLAMPADLSAGDRGHARAGVMGGFTSSSSNAKNFNVKSVSQYNVGLTAQLPLAFGFALQPALLYQSKGTALNSSQSDDSEMKARVSYLEIPVQIQWGPDLVAFRPYAFAEPFIGYGLDAKVKYSGTSSKTSSFEEAGLSRWEYGLGLGAGVDVWKLQVSVKYYWNFGSLYDDSGKLSDIGQNVKDAFKDGRNFNGITISLAMFF